jgi:hypothetical protein
MTHMVVGTRALRDRSTAGALAAAAAVLFLGTAFGLLGAWQTAFAIPLAAGLMLLGVASMDLTLVPVVSVAGTLLLMRVGDFVSVSDAVLAAAALVSLVIVRGRGVGTMRTLLYAGSVYLVLAIPTLVWRPFTDNYVEWIHEVVLVLGSMIVGFAIGREGKAHAALTLYVVACSLVGIAAAIMAFIWLIQSGQFIPVYLGVLHKNAIGGMLASAVVIAYARPPWLRWSRGWSLAAMTACWIGIFASQSRQGIVGAGVGMLIVGLRPYVRGMRRPKLIWIAAAAVAVLVAINVDQQLNSDNPYNSANARLTWYAQSIRVWQDSPIFGNGLRWWYTEQYQGSLQPPNAELEVISSVGVVGLVGFLAMFLIAAVALAKLPPVYGTMGFAVVAARFAQAQFDLYWVASAASLLWIVAGICYGVMEKDRADGTTQPLPEPPALLRLRS